MKSIRYLSQGLILRRLSRESSEESMVEDDHDMQMTPMVSTRRSRLRWSADVDFETRIAYGKAFMSNVEMRCVFSVF